MSSSSVVMMGGLDERRGKRGHGRVDDDGTARHD